jgi:LPS-assembly protein
VGGRRGARARSDAIGGVGVSGRRWWALAVVVWACGTLLPAVPVAAGPDLDALGEGADRVTVDAEEIDYDRAANVVTARGAVKITRGTMVLTGDLVRIDRTTQVATAEGNVVLSDREGTVTADSMALDLLEETGYIDNGSVLLNESRYQIWGRRFEKQPGQSYRIQDGRFTTCRCGAGEPASWSVRGEQVTLDLDGYCWVEGGTFAILDVPILRVPYGVFPVKRERQSGLLYPRVGFSNRRGLQVTQPLYVDINKSMDATITLDVETSARVGVLAEYRYALSRDTHGELHGSYFNEQIRGQSLDDVVNSEIADPHIPIDRWSAGLEHDQWLPWGIRGYADVFRVSDDLFLREINVFTFNPGVDVALRTRRFGRSRVGAARTFDRGAVALTSTWYQDFINPDDFVFQQPPRVDGVGLWHALDDRVLLHVRGTATNFERDEGFEGQRVDVQPEVEVPWRVGRYAFGSVRGGFRETAYHLDDTFVPDPNDVNTNPADPASPRPTLLPALDTEATREVFYLRGHAETGVSRVFDFTRFGIARLKHTLEPRLDYLYVPRTDTRQAALPFYDEADRVNERSVVTYGVTSRLLARMAPRGEEETGRIHELARLSLFQSYDTLSKGGDFIQPVDDETGEVLGGGNRVSDLAMYLRLTPAEALRFEGRADYSVTGDRAKGATVGLVLADPREPADDFTLPSLRGRSQIGLGYRFVANNAVEDINASLLFRLTKRFYAAYETRYDVVSDRFLENRYGFRVISDCECWVIDVGVAEKRNPDEVEGRVLISLIGLGEVGKEPLNRSLGSVVPTSQGFIGQ